MSDPAEERPLAPVPVRRLSGTEVDAILRRASLAETPLAGATADGLTVDELAAAAAEAGLDPATVRVAAAVVPPRTGGPAERLLGGADRRTASAFLPGARIPEERSLLTRLAEAGMGAEGTVTDSGPGTFEWHARGAVGDTRVALREQDGGTEVRVSARRGGQYFGLWLLGLGGWAGLSALTPLGSLGPLGFAASFLLVPILLARPLWARADRRTRARVERTALELARAVDRAPPR